MTSQTDIGQVLETMTRTMNAAIKNDKYTHDKAQRTAYLTGMRELAEAAAATLTAESGGR